MDETWRCFVAIPVPPRLRSRLTRAVAAWKGEPNAPDLRWTDPEGWHVTLAFLGATSAAHVPEVVSALRLAASSAEPFRLRTGGVGAFPRPGSARAIWYGIADPDGRLAELAARVQEAVLPPEGRGRFQPHVTLARSRARRGERLGPWLATLDAPSGELTVDTVTLYRSHLGRGPARYKALASLALGGAGSVRG